MDNDSANVSTKASPAKSFKALRWSFALLLVAALLAFAAVAGVRYLVHETDQAHKRALAQQAETRAKLARVNDDEREIREKVSRYHELVTQGRIAPERRLEWVEILRNIKEKRRLLALDYEIAPQRLLDEKAPTAGGYAFMASSMKLAMPLLHEYDLLGLLADLAAQVPYTLISVKSCKLERTAATSASATHSLTADCEIDWVTLQEKS